MNSKAQVTGWADVCAVSDVIPGTGVAARINGAQVALFHTEDGFFALGNHDPFSDANVLARGILGDIGGKLVVASPVYKQHFCLHTGICLEDMAVNVPTWPVTVRDGRVLVAQQPSAQ
ncbi:nitrite reductase small subunit NirD [Alcanivorax sp. JB21]|uniref:nitrite reductase small subunit NirD n=1 Tax=Alcanivorax limicola TaxID=2874102 RepID=UPI001CBE9B61|nr:nitrite reductase small subunit NirD [Alcanivorax limicola]MBZ2187784.1 nitrite reductase small subunit NirD [Alcanivorax limicola]